MTVIETVDNALLLKNNKDDGLVSLSEIEYDILQIWSRSNDSKEVIERFEKEYEIDENIINTLIDKAIKLKVLCRKDNVFNKKYKTGSPLQYLFVKIIFFLNVIFRVNIVPVFDGGFRFFKLFYYDFSCSRLKNFLTN